MNENNDYENERLDIEVESEGNKIAAWLKKNIAVIFLVALSIYFVFSGSIEFVPNEMNWYEKIVYIFTTLIFGWIINQLVGETGYTAGKDSELYITARDEVEEYCEKALPMRKEAEMYVSNKIDHDIKEERIEMLAKASINYEEVFSEHDIPYSIKKLKKEFSNKQIKVIKNAIRIKKVPFTLFGFTAVKSVGRKEAPSESKRRKSKLVSSFAIKVLMAIASGSVAFHFLGISLSSLLYSVFQLLLWFGAGLITRSSNYNFIVGKVRDNFIERKWYLKEFLNLSEEEKAKLTEQVSLMESQREDIKRLTMKR